MKIAILSWGSLLWQPKDLQFNQEIGWSNNGPMLPIEFARISKDGRLTLVITKDVKEVKVPNVVGLTTEKAIKMIKEKGFKTSDFKNVSSDFINLYIPGSSNADLRNYSRKIN